MKYNFVTRVLNVNKNVSRESTNDKFVTGALNVNKNVSRESTNYKFVIRV